MAQIPGYYTVAEAAKILDRSPMMITRYIRMDKLPAKKIGPCFLIEQSAVHNFTPPPRGNPNFGRKK